MSTIALCFRLQRFGDSYRVRLSADGFEVAESPFELDLGPESRLSSVAAQIEANYADRDHLADVGSNLWAALLSGEAGLRFDEVCEAHADADVYHVRLAIPPELQHLPWETLYDEKKRSFLASHPRFCIIREQPDGVEPIQPAPRAPGPLSVLVVIPEGSGLQVAHEWRNLQYAVEKLGDAIRIERLDGLVTPERVADKLLEGWDVVHFVGHGQVDEMGLVRIRLNDESASDRELWAEAEQFSNIFIESGVQLAVLNCCLGAHPSPSRSLSGLGPFLLRAGLPAVVAMRYEIQDDDAIRFSRSFYGHLLDSADTGRIDLAAIDARRSLYLHHREDNVRGFVTPVVFLAPGFEQLPDLEPTSGNGVRPGAGAIPVSMAVPEALLSAIRETRCVPVVGPGLGQGGAPRAAGAPPGPRELAELLARAFEYPRQDDLWNVNGADAWAADLLLQRVCQHIQFVKRDEPFRLVMAIRDAYRAASPPASYSALAQLNVPGIVYTHYDGLMAEALDRAHRTVRVVNRVDQQITTTDDAPLLVHLRGTVTDADTLVLTEEDHEKLWDAMANLSSQVSDLLTGDLGRSLLIVGPSPRDPLLRRFIKRLLPHGPSKTQGPIFFVYQHRSPADEAYWARYHVRWIDEAPHAVVQAAAQVFSRVGAA